MTDPAFEPISSRVLARGALVGLDEVVMRSPSGAEVVRDVVRHPGGVAVLPIEGDRVWLIRQHRVALEADVDEIPAGTLDEPGEDPAVAARRELGEELGATASRFEHLATMAPSPGYTDEIIEIFVAEGLEFSERTPDGEEEREASVFSIPIVEALDSISHGKITDAKTLVALLEWNRRQG